MLNLTGNIDEAAYDKLCEYLNDAGGIPVTIRINSGGGSHSDSLAMYSVLRAYRGSVTTIVVGLCQSAAVLVFAAGDIRIAARESWFMVHEESGKVSGSTSELKSEIAYQARQETQWAELLEYRTGVSRQHWDTLSRATTYLNAEEAKEMGLVQTYLKEKNA